MNPIFTLLLICFGAAFAILATIFLVVPVLRGVGYLIGAVFNGIGWLFRHTFDFVSGVITDAVRFVGALIAWVVLVPIMLLSVVVGRWSAAGHFYRSMKRECNVASTCLYRVLLQRPLRFLLLGGLLEGLEQRVGEALEAAPTADAPSRRTGTFEGYTIVGSLPGGGSGARLYIAEPDAARRAKDRRLPQRVVIKAFTITDGSSLPQIVRESRALEAARQLGLVLDHGLDSQRFFYVMPYHEGDHLGIITRQLHGRSDGQGLAGRHLETAFGYVRDLLRTLSRYHQGGLWHKDVKPDNVIVHDGRAHLVDLGLVTPLRSAMTLTTHGTEYFRDPEMVRMALRGVKVHQVDGAKFDIYAAGAVCYFVLENTFPAHGGLSAFMKRSPEAARWIVRRAMADYNKRYETAEQVLADLEHVASAPDPFAVKPAELPSMRGAGAEAASFADAGETVASAGSPRPPKQPQPGPAESPWAEAAGAAAEVEGEINAAAASVEEAAAEFDRPRPAKPAPQRPRIRVTNWWTGAYEVLDPQPGADAEADRAGARAFRHHVHGLRQQSRDLRRGGQVDRVAARRAAREQIRAARDRAREIRSRIHTRRPQPVRTSDREPSGMMAFLGLAVLAGFVLIGYAFVSSRPAASTAPATDDVLAMGSVVGAPAAASDAPDVRSVLLLNDHPAAHPEVLARVERIARSLEQRGIEVVFDDETSEVEIRRCLPPGPLDPQGDYPLLRRALQRLHLGGVVRVRATAGEGDPHERIEAEVIALPRDTETVEPRDEALRLRIEKLFE